jgi:hypothetical protein
MKICQEYGIVSDSIFVNWKKHEQGAKRIPALNDLEVEKVFMFRQSSSKQLLVI